MNSIIATLFGVAFFLGATCYLNLNPGPVGEMSRNLGIFIFSAWALISIKPHQS